MTRTALPLAECGYCHLAGPDQDGQYDLLENDLCLIHGDALADDVCACGAGEHESCRCAERTAA